MIGSFSTTRIPTFLGLGLLVVAVGGLALVVSNINQVTKFLNFASGGATPLGVEVANVSDNSFTVYWTTDKEDTGAIAYGKVAGLGDGVAVDERDLSGSIGKYLTHLIRVSGLVPGTKYYYKVESGRGSYGDPSKAGAPYEVMTGAKLAAAAAVDPIYGKVTDGADSGAIAVWQTAGAARLAALVKKDGNYVLPVGNARASDLSGFVVLPSGTAETVTIISGSGTGTISCVSGKDRPLPTVRPGESADCQKAAVQKPSEGATGAAPSAGSSGFKAPKKTAGSSGGDLQVNLSTGETVSSPLPTISGKAGAGQVVKITIHSDTTYSGTVMADPAGNWSWTPPANLSPGQHTVTITVVNADGTTQSVTRDFTVAAGSPILPITSGTPSATLTHKACANNACLTVAGLGSDSCNSDTDCQLMSQTATPSASPAATPAPAPTPKSTPATGAVENTLIVLILGLGLVTLGGILRVGQMME